MRILVSNDDGYQARGLRCLVDSLTAHGEVRVVAPDRDRSGASNSLTLDVPIRARQAENGFVYVNGTPTDCVHLAITGLLEEEPDIVVSGINSGPNLGDDVLYSGTVAAAMEGRFLGLPSIAVSLASREARHYETAAAVIGRLVGQLSRHPIPSDVVLNINVPDVRIEEIAGWKVTRLGHRHRAEPVVRSTDPRGHAIYWVGPPGGEQDAGPGTDFDAIREGCVSITPIKVDLTHHSALGPTAEWIDGLFE